MKILFGTSTCFIWYNIISYVKYSKEPTQAVKELIQEKKLLRSEAGPCTSNSLPVESADFTFRMSKKLSIFFSSKLCDNFFIPSDGLIFSPSLLTAKDPKAK